MMKDSMSLEHTGALRPLNAQEREHAPHTAGATVNLSAVLKLSLKREEHICIKSVLTTISAKLSILKNGIRRKHSLMPTNVLLLLLMLDSNISNSKHLLVNLLTNTRTFSEKNIWDVSKTLLMTETCQKGLWILHLQSENVLI
jgi:hypothetical protein